MCEFISIMFSVIFSGIAIKIADDYLDQDMDKSEKNLARNLGSGSMLYAMVSIALAASLNTSISISLFLASYIIGMFHDLRSYFPSRLNGFQESSIIFIAGAFLLGWKMMLFSFFFVISIQLIDDYIDDYKDELVGQRNWAHRIGKVECFLLFVLTLLISWLINEEVFPAVFVGAVVLYTTILYYQKGRL